MPSDLDGPFCDMASSAVAAGKINLALARGNNIPEGWIVDKKVEPQTLQHSRREDRCCPWVEQGIRIWPLRND